MKKILVIMFVVITCAMIASSAFADVTISTSSTTVIGGANFVPSTNVSLTATATGTDYCVTSAHSSSLNQGSGREWGSYSQGASAIFYKVAPTALDACSAATALPSSGWTAQ